VAVRPYYIQDARFLKVKSQKLRVQAFRQKNKAKKSQKTIRFVTRFGDNQYFRTILGGICVIPRTLIGMTEQ